MTSETAAIPDQGRGRIVYESAADADYSIATTKLTAKQYRFVFSEAKRVVAVAGIRGGKTHAGALKTLLYAMQHPTKEDEVHLVVSPTYPMSKVPVEKLFRLLYDKTIFPVCPLLRYSRSDRTFYLNAVGGGVAAIAVRSAHDPDRLRGLKVLSAWIDEGAYCSNYAWEVIQGRLADVDGPCWVTTTPNGFNWVYDLYEQAKTAANSDLEEGEEPEIDIIHWTSQENTFIATEGIARLSADYDDRTRQQELGARFVRGRGVVYYAFNRSKHVRYRPIDPRLPLYIGQDFNVDPMASVIAQPFKTIDGQDGIHVVESFQQFDSSTWKLVSWLKEWLKRHSIAPSAVTFFPDASGTARSTSGQSDFQIIKAAGFHVSAPARNPFVKDRVNCVNGLLRPMGADGQRKAARLLINPGHTEALIESLEKQTWKKDSNPAVPDKMNGFDHLNDALGYMCWRLFPLRRRTVVGSSDSNAHAGVAKARPPIVRRKTA